MLKIPWTTKPPLGTPIDQSNPLGLVAFYPLNEAGGTRIFTDNFQYVGNVGNSSVMATYSDFAWVSSGLRRTAGYGDLLIRTKIGGLSPFSLMLEIQDCSLAASVKDLFDYAQQTIRLRVGNGNATVYINSNVVALTTSYTFQNNNKYVFVITFDGATLSLYINGKPIASAAWSTSISSTSRINFTGDSYSNGSVATYNYVGTFARCLIPSEIASLSANPWQIYQPQIIPLGDSGALTFLIDDSSSTSSADNVVLTQGGGTFAVADSASASSADNFALIGNFIIADSGSGSSADNVTLIGNFTIDDSGSASSADNVVITLGVGNNFVINDASSVSSCDNIALTQGGGTLAIADASSTSSADNVALTFNGSTLVISDSASASSADNVIIIQPSSYILNPNIFVNTGAVAVQYTGLKISFWNTANRPPPVEGLFGFNTDTKAVEVYQGGIWN